VPFPRPSWGGDDRQAQGTEARRDGGKKGGAEGPAPMRGPHRIAGHWKGMTTHNDSSEWTGGFSRSETSGWQAEGSAHPRAGRTHSKSDRGFMTIHLSPADAPCRVTAGDVNHNQTDGGGKERTETAVELTGGTGRASHPMNRECCPAYGNKPERKAVSGGHSTGNGGPQRALRRHRHQDPMWGGEATHRGYGTE